MNLLTKVIVRIALIALACLACTSTVVMYQAHTSIEAETRATAERVGEHLQRVYWNRLIWRDGMNRPSVVPFPEWQSLATADAIAPGLCVTFAAPMDQPRRLCSRVEKVATPAPAWFATLNHVLFATPAPARWSLTNRAQTSGILYASVEPEAVVRLAWAKVSIVLGVAAGMTFAIALLACLTIGHALQPARTIVDGLKRLQDGVYGDPLPRFRTQEFAHVAAAVEQLGTRLQRSASERARLTAQLFRVQEDERRSIARDLHDEFGQCLSATSALAALIETKAGASHPDIASDARVIARTQQRMMTALRGTLARLRSQNIEEIGLEASLRELVAERNLVSPGVYRLSVAGRTADVPRDVAVGIYRTAQECLTNAARHGTPSAVALRIELPAERHVVTVSVEDDGGGNLSRLHGRSGHGLLGLRERIGVLGGSLSFSETARGIRVSASIPVGSQPVRAAA